MIKLRDSRTKKDIRGTLEIEHKCGIPEGVHMALPNSATRIGFDWGAFDTFDEELVTKLDEDGDRIFLDEDGAEVPEEFVEPYCEGMDKREFGKVRVDIDFVGEGAKSVLCQLLRERLERADRQPGEAIGSYIVTGFPNYRVINATEMSLSLQDANIHPSDVCLDDIGRPYPAQLAKVPSPWDDREGHPIEDWRREIAENETRQSYEQWCDNREEQASHTGSSLCKECGGEIPPGTECDSAHCEALLDTVLCRTCGQSYGDAGDGYDGECPSCADKTAEVHYFTLRVGVSVTEGGVEHAKQVLEDSSIDFGGLPYGSPNVVDYEVTGGES